jgi:polyhydroxybutyrate depolymerase
VFATLLFGACSRPAPELGAADYAALQLPRACAPGDKAGPAGAIDRLSTTQQVAFSVRTPSNYDARLAHPLLVVFAPAGKHRFGSEAFYALTREATAAGFVVAYPDHLRLSMRAFDALAEVPGLIAARWCVDPGRVFLAGHSDGASSAAAIAFLRKSAPAPRAIALSAAGIRGRDLAAYACPAPLSVLVVHSRGDTRFPVPAYGLDAARWWAACNGCAPGAPRATAAGCVQYPGCAGGVRTVYCEVDLPHEQWPRRNAQLLAFLGAASPPQ